MFYSCGTFFGFSRALQGPEIIIPRFRSHTLRGRPGLTGLVIHKPFVSQIGLESPSGEDAHPRQQLDRRRRGILHIQRKPLRATDTTASATAPATPTTRASTADLSPAATTTPDVRYGQVAAGNRRRKRKLCLICVFIY